MNVAQSNMRVNYCLYIYLSGCLISIYLGCFPFPLVKNIVFTPFPAVISHTVPAPVGNPAVPMHVCPQKVALFGKCNVLQYGALALAQYSLRRLRSTPPILSNCQTHTKKTADNDEKNTMTQCENLKS